MPDTHVGVEDNPGPGEGRIRGPNNQGAQPGRTGGHRAVTSTYRGVCWHRKSRRWQSAINISGKHIYLGSFDTEEEAARTFDKVALRVRGSRAKLNFPSQDYLDPDGALTPEPHLERLVAEARKALLEKQRCQERDAYEQREQYATETKRRRLQAGADSAAVRLINGSDVYTGPRGMMPPGIEMGLSGLGSGWGSTDLSGIAVLHPHLPGVDMAAALAGSSASAGGGPAGPGGGMWVLQQQQREEDVRQARLRCLQRQQAGWWDTGDGGGSGSMYGDDVGAPGGPMDGFHHGHEAPAGHGQQAYCGRPEVPQAGSLRRHHLIPLQSTTDAVKVLGTTGPSSRVSGAGPGLLSAPGLMHVQTLAQLPPRRGPPGDLGEPSEWASGRITVGGAGLQLTQGAFVYQRDGVLPAGACLHVRGESSGGLAFTQSGRCEGNNNNGSGGGGDVYGEGGSSIPLALIGRFLTGVGRELPLGCSVKLLVPCSDPDLLGYTYTKELPGQGQADREGEGGGGEGARAMDPTTGKRTLPSQLQRGSADGEGGSGGGAGIYFRGMYRDLGLYTTTVDAMQACKACMAVLLDCRHMLAAEGGVAAEARGLPPPPLLSHTQAPLTALFRKPDVETLAAVAEAVQSARGSSAWPLNRNQPPAGAPGIKVLHDTPVSGLQPPLRMPPQGPPLHSPKQQPSSTAPHNVQDAAPAATWFHPPPATTTTAMTTTTTQAPRLYRAHHMDREGKRAVRHRTMAPDSRSSNR